MAKRTVNMLHQDEFQSRSFPYKKKKKKKERKNCALVRVRQIGHVSLVFGVSVQLVQWLRREGRSFHCACAEEEVGKLADGQKHR